jgi:hypothetical protein
MPRPVSLALRWIFLAPMMSLYLLAGEALLWCDGVLEKQGG